MKRIISLVTLFTVFLLVGFGARFTIEKGLESKSNSQLIAELIDRSETPVLALRQSNSETAVLGTSTSNQTGDNDLSKNSIGKTDTDTCREQLTYEAKINRSIVDYLDGQKMDSTFSGRQLLASKYKIQHYIGTAEQNTELIYLLLRDRLCPGLE